MDEAQRKLVWEALLDADLLGRALSAKMRRQERLHRGLALVAAMAGTGAFAAVSQKTQGATVSLLAMLATQVNAIWAFRDCAREIAGIVESCAAVESTWELLWADINAGADCDERVRDAFAQWQTKAPPPPPPPPPPRKK